ERRLVEMCSVGICCLPDIIDEREYITLAVALFILDNLLANRNIWEAMLYIPDSEELLYDIELPEDFSDAVFENSVIKGMMYLIIHRDDEVDTYLNTASAKRTEDTIAEREYIYAKLFREDMSDIEKYRDEKRAEADNMTCRECLDKVLSYMEPAVVERAEQRFKSKLFEFTDIVYDRFAEYEGKIDEVIQNCIMVCDELYLCEERLLNTLHKRNEEHKQKKVNRSSILSVKPMELPELDANSFSSPFGMPAVPDELDGRLDKLKELSDKLDMYDDERADIMSERYRYTIYAMNCREGYTFMVYDFNVESEKFNAFRVDNPYEICFAYFSLLDSGSDLVWLVPLAGVVLRFACELLPWTKTVNENLFDYMHHAILPDEESFDEEAEEPETIPDYIEREARFYSLEYTDYSDWMDQGVKRVKKQDLMQLNFPQFVFKETGLNIPRRTDIFEDRDKELVKSGISKKNIELLRMYLDICICADGRIGFDKKRREKAAIGAVDKVHSVDTLKSIISEKSDEIVRLKAALHKAENELKNEKKKSEKTLSDSEMERRELSELRELIYNLQNNTEEETQSGSEEIELPYTAQSNIVIFGGHASWLRAFRPLIKNVRIIDPYTNPDINLIRNADVVWMQTNAMPHSFYNKIMDIVRLRKIPVKYFAYASAEKCARQLAADDMKDKR
ncbi:MAG: hypothetical protein ACI4SF_08930, partial [Oscillospiraceae bacterium]